MPLGEGKAEQPERREIQKICRMLNLQDLVIE